MAKDQFVLLRGLNHLTFVNPSLIATATLRGGELLVHMSNGVQLNLHGKDKDDLMGLLTEHAVLPNGQMPVEVARAMREGIEKVWERNWPSPRVVDRDRS